MLRQPGIEVTLILSDIVRRADGDPRRQAVSLTRRGRRSPREPDHRGPRSGRTAQHPGKRFGSEVFLGNSEPLCKVTENAMVSHRYVLALDFGSRRQHGRRCDMGRRTRSSRQAGDPRDAVGHREELDRPARARAKLALRTPSQEADRTHGPEPSRV